MFIYCVVFVKVWIKHWLQGRPVLSPCQPQGSFWVSFCQSVNFLIHTGKLLVKQKLVNIICNPTGWTSGKFSMQGVNKDFEWVNSYYIHHKKKKNYYEFSFHLLGHVADLACRVFGARPCTYLEHWIPFSKIQSMQPHIYF